MLTRRIDWTDENGRVMRSETLKCNSNLELKVRTKLTLERRHQGEAMVFTNTRDSEAAPEGERFIDQEEMQQPARLRGMQVIEPVTRADYITAWLDRRIQK